MKKFIIATVASLSLASASLGPTPAFALADNAAENVARDVSCGTLANFVGTLVGYTLGGGAVAILFGSACAQITTSGSGNATFKQDLILLEGFRKGKRPKDMKCNENPDRISLLPEHDKLVAYMYPCRWKGAKMSYVLLGVDGDKGWGVLWTPDRRWADAFPWGKALYVLRKGKKPYLSKVTPEMLGMASNVVNGTAPKLRLK